MNSTSLDCTGAERHQSLSSVEVGNARELPLISSSAIASILLLHVDMHLPQVQKMILTRAQRKRAQQNRKKQANNQLIPSFVSCSAGARELLDCAHTVALRA